MRPKTFNISQVKSFLSSAFGIGAGRTDSENPQQALVPRITKQRQNVSCLLSH
ncbi:unnamed protein product [Aphanomyces euteiches]